MASNGCGAGAIDLHIHTTASDGSESPQQVMEMALGQGLAAISITDHDTVSGVREILKNGVPGQIEFVPGVEISAQIPEPFPTHGTLHILGYFIHAGDPGLNALLDKLGRAREDRNPQIIQKLQALGIPITYDQVEKASGGGQVGRPHIAQVLLDMGRVESISDAFDRYIARGKPAFVDKYRLPAKKALDAIHQAGGAAVCAHPFALEMQPKEMEDCIRLLAGMGLDGLEVYYPAHGDAFTRTCLDLAAELGLAVTGGTDYHGATKPEIRMGCGKGDMHVPFSLLREIQARSRKWTNQAKNLQAPD